jgi:DNA polymerase III subunit epsilon
VAALRVVDGQVVDRFETLVDPGRHIPPFITSLTGISERMLHGKPRMSDIAPSLFSFLAGAVFVAHNVNFDHEFLRAEFKRLGMHFDSRRLCTVRLSRRVFPGFRSYSLDGLMRELHVDCENRHRAGDDADVTAEILIRMLHEMPNYGVDDLDGLSGFQEMPRRNCEKIKEIEHLVAPLPSRCGVYMMKDEEGHVLYVGKSTNIRRRVREHFRPDADGQRRLHKILKFVKRVDHIETASELEALLLESRLIKHCLPQGNKLQRDFESYPFIKLNVKEPFPRIELTREPEDEDVLYFGPFTQSTTVNGAISAIQDEFGLRTCNRRFKQTEGSCARRDFHKCLAPCSGEISREQYMERVEQAIDLLGGRSSGYLLEMERKMEGLAENLRFEEAAALRDRILSLRSLVHVQEKLSAAGGYDLVVVSGSVRDGWRELFFIRQGRLALQLSCPQDIEESRLREILERVYTLDRRTMAISKGEVDEMHIIADWLRRGDGQLTKIPIYPNEEGLAAALKEITGSL